MGLIAGFALTGMVIYGVYALLYRPDERKKLLAEFREDRLTAIVVLVWVGFLMIFLWGLLIPPLGDLQVHLGAMRLALWEIGGFGSLIGFVIGLVWDPTRRR